MLAVAGIAFAVLLTLGWLAFVFFRSRLETLRGHLDAILPEIAGRAWITGTHQHMLDPADPWPEGYRLSDTWGAR